MKAKFKLGPEISPGRRVMYRRKEGEDHVTPGTFEFTREGQPIPEGADYVELDPSPPSEDGWRDGTVIYSRATSDGPAQVATKSYRDGYDRIFGKKTVGLA